MQGLELRIKTLGFQAPVIHIRYTGIFTVVQVISDRDDGMATISAEGISRRSYLDRPEAQKGIDIAKGRGISKHKTIRLIDLLGKCGERPYRKD